MKILEICAKLNIGGAQAVAANIARYAAKDMSFTYVVFGDEIGEHEADVIANGNRVVHIPSPSFGKLGFFKNIMEIMGQGNFNAVHCHTMYSCGIVMLAAKLSRIPGRISHSHSTKDEARQGILRKSYKLFMKAMIKTCGNEYLSCGVEAGYELYGKLFFDKYGQVIKNGIDISKYGYSEENRRLIRKQYNTEDCFVIGHVGHYVNVKNQDFLIKMMPKLAEKIPNAILLLFGEGENRERLEALINGMNLGSRVRLMGNVDNVNEILSAFDVFVFPSFHEATPLSLIEAQANGVPCIVSDTIPDDACFTDLITKLPIDDEKKWIELICNAKRNRSVEYSKIVLEGYEDIHTSMEKIYSVFRKYEGKYQ